MTYMDIALCLILCFTSTIFFMYSITTFFARKPVRLFGAKFSNMSIKNAENFNRINALLLLLLSIPGYMGCVVTIGSISIGRLIWIFGYSVVVPFAVFGFYINKQLQTKRLLQSFMFSISKNNTIIKFELFKRDSYVEAFEYINIAGSAKVLQSNLKKKVFRNLMEFMDDNELESWNGFAKQKGEPGKGVEWKIKAVYDNGESIFAFGKDEYPLNGKAIIGNLNDLLNESFIKMKR